MVSATYFRVEHYQDIAQSYASPLVSIMIVNKIPGYHALNNQFYGSQRQLTHSFPMCSVLFHVFAL